MARDKISNFFPIAKLIKLLIFLSIGLQLIIISQMYFFGSDIFSDPVLVVIRIFRGLLLTFIAGAILAYPSIHLIRLLNKRLPWKRYYFKRFFIQFPLAVLYGILVTPLILFPAIWFFGLESDFQTLLNNTYYLFILALFLMIILEARIYFDESNQSKIAEEKLTQELIMEAANRATYEAQIKIEEEKNWYAQKLIEKEKQLNRDLEGEIKKREIITKELKESREQLDSILTNLSGATYRCHFDEHYTMKYISEKIFDISGFHASEFMDNSKKTFSSIIHPDDHVLVKTRIQEAASLKINYEIEYRIIHKNGHTVWVNENGKCIYNTEGFILFLDGIIVDISRRREAEIAAKESERNYKELMHFLPQPVFELDIEGTILFNNKAGQDFFGLADPEESDEKISALDFFVDEDIPRVIENIKKLNLTALSAPNEYTVKRPDGTLCPVLIYGAPIVRNNKVVGRRGIIVDISERKKYELGLLQAKEELKKMNDDLEKIIEKRTNELTKANMQLLKVQKENLQSQFEVLKSQINPHFMFNSLNVLSGLIATDSVRAQQFIDEFSHIYRYVLESIEQPVSSLEKELDFMRSYLFLQQIRHGDNLSYSVNIAGSLLGLMLPPLSLQVVLENAIKHNIVNNDKPLHIDISCDGEVLMIKNNIQPVISRGISTGMGLKNLQRRYALVSDQTPEFRVVNRQYVARLPLINPEQDEGADH